MRRTLPVALTVLLLVSRAEAARRPAAPEPVRRVLRLRTGRVEAVPLEAYVAAVLPGEIGGAAPRAALEAQAIAVRSYALARDGRHADAGADLCDGVHCQVFMGLSRATRASRQAAEATRGLVLVQRGKIISAPYHAVCGGKTARPSEVWEDRNMPDLEPVVDDACLGAPGARWTFFLPRAELGRIADRLGLPDGRFFEVYGRGDDGRVTRVRLANPAGRYLTARGFDFRAVASELFGWSSVRSTAFTVSELPKGYLLSGTGTGHGAGLCQAGAIVRAARGESRAQILATYYRGASVVPLGSLARGRQGP